MSWRGLVDGFIALGLLPIVVVTGAVFMLWFALGWLVGKGWEHEAEDRGKRFVGRWP